MLNATHFNYSCTSIKALAKAETPGRDVFETDLPTPDLSEMDLLRLLERNRSFRQTLAFDELWSTTQCANLFLFLFAFSGVGVGVGGGVGVGWGGWGLIQLFILPFLIFVISPSFLCFHIGHKNICFQTLLKMPCGVTPSPRQFRGSAFCDSFR